MPVARKSDGSIDVGLEVVGDESGGQLNDLRRWLRSDDDLTGVRVQSVAKPPASGEMSGGESASLIATVLDPDLLAPLLGALGGWAAARASTRRTRVRVKVGEHEVEIDGAGLRDPEGVARRIRAELGEAP
jgi:hypothetical protein